MAVGYYVGAGTSGRLGVLDASDVAHLRARPEQVQGIIAGGPQALTQAIEGAEDDADAGRRAIQFRGVNKKDVVIGIAASGNTPFVWGALETAAQRGARTALICVLIPLSNAAPKCRNSSWHQPSARKYSPAPRA